MDSPVSPRAATPRPTIKDIASAAGVSNVTVSRVLNTPELVREETRGRVEAAMRRLGYTPNLAARAMRTRFTRTIGFLVPDILSYPNAAVAQAAEQALAAAGYGMMLVSSGDRHEDELRALEMLRTHRMDGMIVYVGDESDADMIGTLSELGGPCVVLDRTLPIEADVVLSDHAPALEEAIRYAGERVQFGKPINRFQAIQMKLAEMATDLEAARRLVHYAAWLKDSELPHMKEASMAKMFASEAGADICDKAARILASYGFAMEYPVQRFLRDIRFTLIGGGTSEILKLVIAKELSS